MKKMKKRFFSGSALLYGGSLLLHVSLAVGVSLLPKQKKNEVVAISLSDVKAKKKDDKAEPPKPPPPPPPDPPAAKQKLAPAPKSAPTPPEPQANVNAPPPAHGMENLLDMGMMGNGSGGGGPSLPARAAGPAPTATNTSTTRKLETLAPVTERCAEPVVRAKRKGGPQPAYTTQARQAEIEGVVKIEVTLDESGRVTAARVAGGLGYGLDEAAIAAAKKWTFDPATKCGKAIGGGASLPFRFKLGS